MSRSDADVHRAEVEAWRAARYASLRRPVGWLTLAGLGWLHEGPNSIGTDNASDVVLPAGPPTAGSLIVEDGRVTAHAAGNALRHDGNAVDGLAMVTDVDAAPDGDPTLLELGRLRMCLIRRGERLALRTWDTESPALSAFAGIPHYPAKLGWRIEAAFAPPDGSMRVAVPDVLGGVEEEPCAGFVSFERGGRTHRLLALEGGDAGELRLVFGDLTNGKETYGGGRYLYTPAPDSGRVVVDFNKAYNPPCVFGPFATCPLPWPENRLDIAVEAGEKTYHA